MKNKGEKTCKKGGKTLKIRVLALDIYKALDLTKEKAIRERCLNCSGWSILEVRN